MKFHYFTMEEENIKYVIFLSEIEGKRRYFHCGKYEGRKHDLRIFPEGRKKHILLRNI